MVTVQDVKERWEQIQNNDERILFIVGGPGSGKSLLIRELSEQKGWKYLEAKQLIEEEFLLVPRDGRGHLEGDQLYLEHNNDPKHAVVTITKPERVMVID